MIAMLLTLFTLLMGCESTPECVVNTDCGQGEACISDTCTAVECMTSAVCTLGQYLRTGELHLPAGLRHRPRLLGGPELRAWRMPSSRVHGQPAGLLGWRDLPERRLQRRWWFLRALLRRDLSVWL